jgi:NAD(P)-dependent dehydrogenase (short-subunit alcohol dehydrogenase family)
LELKNKTALVVGGASGMGRGIAEALAREGCRVAIADRNLELAQKVAAEFKGPNPLTVHWCDVADRQSVLDLFAWAGNTLGPLDISVNGAGINVVKRSMAEMNPADWDRILAVNVTGIYNCMYAALPEMRKRRSGLIVNISSYAGRRVLQIAGVAYCASKFAATALGLAVGLEDRAHGIRVTNLYPGEVNTAILDQRPEPVPPEKKAQMVQPADIAACVVMVAKLPPNVSVPELVVVPVYQGFA